MPRVEHDQTHALEHALLHPRDDLVADVAVGLVAPPSQHVGLRQPGLRQTVLGLLQRRRAHVRRRQQQAQPFRDRRMHALRIHGGDFRVGVLVHVFPPDHDSQRRN